MQDKIRIAIVGGVAGGASAATRARRLSELAEITIFEKGPYVSFANCGLPYYVGEEIKSESDLLLQTPQSFKNRYNIDVRVNSEVVEINRTDKKIRVKDLTSGNEYWHDYDYLILSPGASPLIPPVPGVLQEGHFVVRNVPDAVNIKNWIKEKKAKNAVIIGGGFIGLEMAEQMKRIGLDVTIVELLEQVLPVFDIEMAAWIHKELKSNGIKLYLKNPVKEFIPVSGNENAKASIVKLANGEIIPADIVILCAGVRPETALAKSACIEIGESGGIKVNEYLQTNDKYIYAIGDAIEVKHLVTGRRCLIPLAGPANRQGRIAANNIFGRKSVYEGSLGTLVVRVFNLTAAATGANEKELKKSGIGFKTIHLHPLSHAGYYPGGSPVAIKLLFSPETRKVLGAQAIGTEGVEKRIDVIATAIKAGMTVDELAELELCYAPPFGSAKDPVNLAGMAAVNALDGLVAIARFDEVEELQRRGAIVLDVRTPAERENGFIPNSIFIPLDELRNRINELPRDKEIIVSCQSGQRSYFACRILSQYGFKVRNLTGSYRTWKTWKDEFGDNKEL
jgi:NADPH-dependent 2,4-dienoyl-CoA reductase/sulfur reductase-like enzyme/rhodanese-related sulfurtransferase